ncbi:MAG: (d)CMP kinase [Sinomonas sp.]|nr:(d)CMP kinase [Sinomonas sp.]
MAGAAVTDFEASGKAGSETSTEISSGVSAASTARGTSVRYAPGGEPVRVGRPLVVAIDGPSGSGKSSVSKEVARRLRLAYLDTGAMYRAVTWDCLDRGLELTDSALVEASARALELELSTSANHEQVFVRGHNVTTEIREPRISASVSAVATNLGVRNELIRRQRALIAAHGRRMVVEGRDITTVVARDAEVRLLLTASEEARLRRRGLQLGGTQSAEALLQQVVERDRRDSTVASFTQAADGVYTVDSSDLDFEETVSAVLDVVHAAVGGHQAER